MCSSSYPISTSKEELQLVSLNNLEWKGEIMLFKMIYLQFEVLTDCLAASVGSSSGK